MISFTLEVTLDSPLHIGGEMRLHTQADRPLLKTADGWPYIPATSIKGVLRHETEQLVRAVLGADAVCYAPQPERMCQPLSGSDLCPVCTIFGSPWEESRLYLSDLMIVAEQAQHLSLERAQTETRPGVRINRRRRTAEDDFLFQTELFQPGVDWKFAGPATFYGSEIDLTPLYVAARAVSMLGGGRSRGLGWCDLKLVGAPEGADLRARWEEWLEARLS